MTYKEFLKFESQVIDLYRGKGVRDFFTTSDFDKLGKYMKEVSYEEYEKLMQKCFDEGEFLLGIKLMVAIGLHKVAKELNSGL